MYYLFDIFSKRVTISAYSFDYLSELTGYPKSTLSSAYYRKTLLSKQYFVTSFYVDSEENTNIRCSRCPLSINQGIYYSCPFDIYSRFSRSSCDHPSEFISKFKELYKPV